jgi:small conductance mechanosensitive channel
MEAPMQDLVDTIRVTPVLERVVAFLPDLGAAVLVLAVFAVLYRLSRGPLSLVLTRAGVHEKVVQLLVRSVYRWTLIAVAIVMAADQVGINVAAAVAGLGVAGIAVGFAAQDTLANVIAGIVIFLDRPFVVGDWVEVDGDYGRVSEITLRSTRIRTPRNTWVVIPNKHIVDVVLENHSKHGEIRIDVPVGIAYKEDIDRAREVLLAAVSKMEGVLDQPSPDVVVAGLGASSVDLKVRVWIHHADREQATGFAVVETAKKALDAAGIQIPFPHLQLFVDQVESRVWERLDATVRREQGHRR